MNKTRGTWDRDIHFFPCSSPARPFDEVMPTYELTHDFIFASVLTEAEDHVTIILIDPDMTHYGIKKVEPGVLERWGKIQAYPGLRDAFQQAQIRIMKDLL